MPSTQKLAVNNHRSRLRKKGLSRLEVVVPDTDKPLFKELARRLRGSPREADEMRHELLVLTYEEPKTGFKELLAAAPLDGIDLDRDRDTGREIDL